VNGASHHGGGAKPISPQVAVTPSDAVRRQAAMGRGVAVELVHAASRKRIELRYRGTSHLLVSYAHGLRRDGETFVDRLPPSSLKNIARRFTFVPAGHDYFEWHQLHASGCLLFAHLDPSAPGAPSAMASSSGLAPRLFFHDATLWSTVNKLMGLGAGEGAGGQTPYLEVLGLVLMHELLRGSGTMIPAGAEPPARGGLAAWQQRVVAAYIEDHLAESIPLATLAGLARLSPYHFSRAFKQSFGAPPHRYHTRRRIERAKTMLEEQAVSVTDIGLTLGFSETSSFTAAFRKTTGLTPSRYHRSIVHLLSQD
jgi:AraC family transcriptional regulator